MLKSIFLGLIVTLIMSTVTFAQTINGDIQTGFNYNLNNETSEFFVKDVYLGVKHSFDDNWSVNTNVNYTGKDINLYNAEVHFSNNLMDNIDYSFRFGRIVNTWYLYTNEVWGNRFINEVSTDTYSLLNRTNDGLNGNVFFSDNDNNTIAIASFEVQNFVKDESQKNSLFTGILFPVENLHLGGFYSYLNKEKIYGFNVGYEFTSKTMGDLNVSAEYDKKMDVFNVISVFGQYFVKDSPFSVLGKYELVKFDNGNTDINFNTFGLNYKANKNVDVGINYRTQTDLDGIFYFNTGITF